VRALERYFRGKGRDVEDAATRSTIDINSTLVPRRGDNVLRWLAELADIPSLSGLRVLELGCGFGALATYLALRERPARFVAIDVSNDYLELARQCASELGLEGVLSFAHADMRELSVLGEQFDALIVNNALIYLVTGADAQCALDQAYRATAPGGAIVFHHANKWRWREPFTKDPLLHLLPTPVARGVSRVTGWRHNHGRVRLLSPPELRRRLRHAGFRNVEIAGVDLTVTGLKRYLSPYSVIAARRTAASSAQSTPG
jgi:ubiquinone/menaquinone biosynthesis C-methylase UbiE